MRVANVIRCAICAALSIAAPAAQAQAQAQDAIGPRVQVELNTAQSHTDNCTLTFLIQNGHAADIDRAVYEAVVFDTSGQVERLTLFDFGPLPAARPRVRQFVISGLSCDGISQILINGAQTCDAPDLDATACQDGLAVSSRSATLGLIG